MRRHALKAGQSGFTLIELIAVIVILGILAATALPKFANLAGDARIAALKGARASLNSVAVMAHGKYLVTVPVPTSVVFEGATITFATVAASGYPKADAGLAAAAGLGGADVQIIPAGSVATANAPATSATETAFIPVSAANSTAGLSCYVKYAEPAAVATAPIISLTTASC